MNGWLSPKAKLFPVKVGGHRDKALELIERGTGQTWVHVTPSGPFSERPLTKSQIKWLVKHFKRGDETWQDMTKLLLEKNGYLVTSAGTVVNENGPEAAA